MKRLIEAAFPLKQASLDSLHEKNVRHGHISTLHIWPARRPLAACRAALLATLLPDPATPEARQKLLDRIGGALHTRIETKKLGSRAIEVEREFTQGGVLHWGNESGPEMDAIRAEIRAAFGGRAPKVLDPFAGGGAIPLEAMRLGCEVTAGDINPVAWFLLKCTLEYPQKLAGQKWPLPAFALRDRAFMQDFLEAQGLGKKLIANELDRLRLHTTDAPTLPGVGPGAESDLPLADLAWQVRAWGGWVLERAKQDLARFYPAVNGEPTVAYLWARTVACRTCRATIPLLKTRWLCKKDNKRVLLTMEPNADKTGVVFGIDENPRVNASASPAQRREDDRRLGAGTMTRAGASCPCCEQNTMSMESIRLEGQAGRLGAVMTAVVVERAVAGGRGRSAKATKAYRLPASEEIQRAAEAGAEIEKLYAEIPFGLPAEPLPSKEALGFRVPLYGLTRWCDLFTSRQLLALGTFVKHTRRVREHIGGPPELAEAVSAYLALALDRLADYSSNLSTWNCPGEKMRGTFGRFALPLVWDYAEVLPDSNLSGGYPGALEWVAGYVRHALEIGAGKAAAQLGSAISAPEGQFDIVLTDPPYYDAIPYSDLMDFFYVWLRRTLRGLSLEFDMAFHEPLGPKWDAERNDGELIDDSSRFDGDAVQSKQNYEDGMARAFVACHQSLRDDGHLLVVFANKQPTAWETLVTALIRAGFVVDASWPIQTEKGNRTRALASAALSSSVWLVCRKRPADARPGWDHLVLEEMQANIETKLREFWDAGIRGPDFLWAATGPALEAYSKHPIVRVANQAGRVMAVPEFLRHARRMVVDFVVGRVLQRQGEAAALDDLTAYYLLHRHSFRLGDAPAGACILYALSCNTSDLELVRRDILARTKGAVAAAEDEEVGEGDGGDNDPDTGGVAGDGPGSFFRLRSWKERRGATLGYDQEGRPAPLIDRVHRLQQLWAAGNEAAVDAFIEDQGLRRQPLLPHVLQAMIELADVDERAKLEAISKHLHGSGAAPAPAEEQLVSADLLTTTENR